MKKNITTAYLLFFFLGIFGAHKFYLKKVNLGIMYLATSIAVVISFENSVLMDLFLFPIKLFLALLNIFYALISIFEKNKIPFIDINSIDNSGIFYFCTIVILVMGMLIDFFTLRSQVRKFNESNI